MKKKIEDLSPETIVFTTVLGVESLNRNHPAGFLTRQGFGHCPATKTPGGWRLSISVEEAETLAAFSRTNPRIAEKSFRVAAVSDNTNAFGLRGVILVARDGESWQVGASALTIEEHKIVKGADVQVPCFQNGQLSWVRFGCELPRELPRMPGRALLKLYPDLTRQQSKKALVEVPGSLRCAFEFGFKCAEKGMNLELAFEELRKIYNADRPTWYL